MNRDTHIQEQETNSSIEKDALLREMWDTIEVPPHFSTGKSYEDLLHARYVKEKKQWKRNLLLYTSGVAALLLILIIPTFFYLQTSQTAEMIYCQVAPGEIREILLPDSSRIQVNSGSLLIYPEKFTGKKRDVFLNGEANFIIAENKKSPFMVHTQDFDIEVLGTSFHINSFSHKTNTSATLKSGKIRISFHDDINPSIEMVPDEQIYYYRSDKLVKKESTNTREVFDWFKGHLSFKSQPLIEVTEILGNKFNKKIYITSADIENSVLTVKFKNNENLEEILETIRLLIPGIDYHIKEDIVLITY